MIIAKHLINREKFVKYRKIINVNYENLREIKQRTRDFEKN